MPDPSKAIGLRLPHHVWEQVKAYGMDNYPSDTSKEGIDVTRTVISLICQALGTTLDAPINDSYTVVVQQQLSALSNDNALLSERLTIVEQLLSKRLMTTVEHPLSEQITEDEKQPDDLTEVVEQPLSEQLTDEIPAQYTAKKLADKLRITPQCLGKWRDAGDRKSVV